MQNFSTNMISCENFLCFDENMQEAPDYLRFENEKFNFRTMTKFAVKSQQNPLKS